MAGLSLGVMTGLFGVEGEFLAVPVMALVLDLPTPWPSARRSPVIAVNASAGLVAHLGLGPIGVPVALAFAAGGLLGALGGQCLASRLSSGALGQAFAVFRDAGRWADARRSGNDLRNGEHDVRTTRGDTCGGARPDGPR